MKPLYMVFDVESVGLHGEGFAVGYVVVDGDGKELASALLAHDPRISLPGVTGDRDWVEANIPPLKLTHTTHFVLTRVFWKAWMEWKEKGALLFADCAWPVEARFLIGCIDAERESRNWQGPYPLHDIASVLLAKGKDPLAKFPRLENELPEHNPLCDARQSARILIEALKS